MDKLFQNRDDEAVCRGTRGVAETQNPGSRAETVETVENHLSKSELSEPET